MFFLKKNIFLQRLIENTEKLERSGRRLTTGRRILNETESIGAAILNDLSSQREKIISARRKVRNLFTEILLDLISYVIHFSSKRPKKISKPVPKS